MKCSELFPSRATKEGSLKRRRESVDRWQAKRHDINGFHAANQGVAAGIIDLHLHELARLPAISIKHHDSVTMSSTDHLYYHLVFWSVATQFTRPFDKNVYSLTKEFFIVLLADAVLDFQQLLVSFAFDFVWNIVEIQVEQTIEPRRADLVVGVLGYVHVPRSRRGAVMIRMAGPMTNPVRDSRRRRARFPA